MSQRLVSREKVWHDLVHDSAIAKTKGTFDAVNTNQAQVKIEKPDAKAILGFYVGYCATKLTDAENIPDLIVRVFSKALGIANEDFVVASGTTDADALTGYSSMITQFVPWRQPAFKTSLFNADMTFSISPSFTSTEGLDVVICVAYANQEPSAQFAIELMAQRHRRVTGGAFNADEAKAHGTGAAAVVLSTLDIPTGRMELAALLGKITPNAITVDDPISGFMEFSASGIPDFSPQLVPLCIFFNPCLGTVIDWDPTPAPGRYYPTRFPLTGAQTTVRVSSTLLVAAGTAPDTTQAILYD